MTDDYVDYYANAVRSAQTNTLRDVAEDLDRANRLDGAALELPQHAEQLRDISDRLRNVATIERTIEGSLAEVVALLDAERIERINTPKSEPRTINDWLAAQPSK